MSCSSFGKPIESANKAPVHTDLGTGLITIKADCFTAENCYLYSAFATCSVLLGRGHSPSSEHSFNRLQN